MSARTKIKAGKAGSRTIAPPRALAVKPGLGKRRPMAAPRAGHDFASLQVTSPARTPGAKAGSCPLSLASPTRCPFGGACHTCPPRVQAKLTVGAPGDRYEREADRVAERVMGMPEPAAAPAIGRIQRRCASCEEGEEGLQAKASPGNVPALTPATASSINSLRGGGRPLPRSARSFFEPRFGHNFTRVRVHTGRRAADTARAVKARAFTLGRDVVFGAGQYAPDTPSGRRLLAHELTHVAQQGGAQVSKNGSPASGPLAKGLSRTPTPMLSRNGGPIMTGKRKPEDAGKKKETLPTPKAPVSGWKGNVTGTPGNTGNCGPEVTDWLINQMNANQNHPVIRTARKHRWARWIPIFNTGWTAGAFWDFANLVGPGKPWDFKRTATWWKAASGRKCPTKSCDETITLCGHCFNYDVPGNIHFGWVGRRMEIAPWALHFGASLVQEGGPGGDQPVDTVAINIGMAMADEGKTLCGEVNAKKAQLNRHRTLGCKPCVT